MTNAVSLAQYGSTGISQGFKNRIINGQFQIDQRNAGASLTPTTNGQYTLDRWSAQLSQASKFSVQQNAGSVTPPAGYRNYLGVTSLSAYSVGANDYFSINQKIEGFNSADLMFGTSNAQTVTISFWVRSSLTGTFGGVLYNADATRNYCFSYTISAANTWEYKTATIAGDTSGTWVGATNGIGMTASFALGAGSNYVGATGSWSGSYYIAPTGSVSVVGTNGATFYITGVQLEVGSTATSFDYRPYGTELALCQRYAYSHISGTGGIGNGNNYATTYAQGVLHFPVTMRATPSLVATTGTNYYYFSRNGANNALNSLSLDSGNTTTRIGWIYNGSEVSGTAGHGGIFYAANAASSLLFNAEL